MRQKDFQDPLIWTYHPFMLKALPPKHGPLVYHCVDDLAAIPGVDAAFFRAEEAKLLAHADGVFTTSEILRQKCSRQNPNTFYFPNVADAAHFAHAYDAMPLPTDLEPIPTPRIGYIGVLSDFKVDFALVFAIAEARPEWHWVFVGEEREGQHSALVARLKNLPNAHFLGFRPYTQLPDYLRGFNVAVLPSLLNEYTRAMFPMKYFEYLAAGVPVVATPLDFTTNHISALEIGENADDFMAAIERQLKHGRLSREESQAAVADNTWGERFEKMMQKLSSIQRN